MWATAVLAIAVGLAACGSSKPATPTVLHVRTGVAALELRQPAAAFFARRVAQLSGGRMRIAFDYVQTPDPHVSLSAPVASDRWLVREARAGHTDLAWVSTHGFEAMGIASLRALDAPMLVDDYRLQTAVLRSALARRMLAGVRDAGVEGLAIVAGRLRRPVDVERPLRGPPDYRGLQLGTALSATRRDAFRALGARVVAGTPQPNFYETWTNLETAVPTRDHLNGLETDLDNAFYDLPPTVPGYTTENVRLWPETAAIIASPARLNRLSADQRSLLRRAATETQTRAFALASGEGATLRDLCSRGARFALASRADRAALRRAFRPVYVRLEQDPLTRDLLRGIASMKARTARGAPPSIPARCSAARRAIPNLPPSPIPDGVYRTRITRHDLAVGHVPPADQFSGFGTLTLTLSGGRYRLALREGNYFDETGPYGGSLARTEFGSDELNYEHHELVTVLDKGKLSFHPVRVREDVFGVWYGAHPWRKIG